jgi:uncharacterized protein
MTVQTSYPGVYIQELPSLVHSIQPAPTSIAVFVGYTNPFLPSTQYLTAIQLFSFADYQTNFGGFFSSPWEPDYVGQAVYQFFINGGLTCYVVALQAKEYYDSSGTSQGGVVAATLTVDADPSTAQITFTALQPAGLTAVPASGSTQAVPATGIPMQVQISNFQKTNASNDTADIVITYGTTVETYRKVLIGNLTSALQNSSLVSVTVPDSATAFSGTITNSPLTYSSAPEAGWTVINPGDFTQVFQDYQSLDKVPIFNLLAIPGISAAGVTSEAVAFCERKRAFYIMDTPSPETTGWDANSLVTTFGGGAQPDPAPPVSINAAVYYPWLQAADPVTGVQLIVPPSGFVAGIYGMEDTSEGVWKSPAGIETALTGTTGVDPNGAMTDPQQGVLNQNAINCLRQFPSVGTVVYGARTTAGATLNTAQQQWRYVAVRRMALFIEQSLYSSLTWAVFQPNSEPLWTALTQDVNAFMLSLFRQGAFAGTKPSDSFLVQCDATTTTPTDVQNGVVNILVGFAPLAPAEFVIVQIAQLAGQAQT